MKYPIRAVLLCALLPTARVWSQAESSEVQASSDEVVVLSPFEVSSNNPARYQAAEAAAGGRIATNIMDSPTTVTVLTSDFLNDIGGTRVLDATKYVAGVSESVIPNAFDSVMIRGFRASGRRVDGFSTGDHANYDHGGIESVEVVKGPDAVLHPAGTPGGTVNLVTKKPKWTYGGGVKLQAGEYDANRIEVDVTGPINDSFAYRAIIALQDNEGYIQESFRKSLLLTPSVTWRIAPQTNLTFRYEFYEWKGSAVAGMPVDPSVGTNGGFKLLQGVPGNFSPAYGKRDEFRHVAAHTGSFLFTSAITDRLSVRLAGRITETHTPASGMRLGLDALGGSYNPFTGNWEGGVLWQNTSADPANPNFVSSPAPQPSSMVIQSGTKQDTDHRLRDLQNDYSYIVHADTVTSTTLVGFAYGYEHERHVRTIMTGPTFDIFNFTREGRPGPFFADSPNTSRVRKLTRYQVYATQQLEFFDKRFIVSGGVAHLTYNGLLGNKLSAATATRVAGQMFPASNSRATYNYGFVLKPVRNVSFHYGHTENAATPNDFQQVAEGTAPAFSEGTQDEFGVKTNFFEGRIIASVAYYEIEQQGYPIFNPLNISVPPPPVQLPDLIGVRKGTGWEFQLTGSITPNLSVIASYADTKNRNPDGVMLGSSAEDMLGFFMRYEFSKGALRGLGASIGVNYLSKRAVENISGYTEASTPDNLIPLQPSAYLPEHTLTDITLNYTRGSWTYGLKVSNVFDEEWYGGADNRNRIAIGTPRNVSGSVSWKF